MSDNTTLNVGASGDVIRDIDRAGVKTQVVQFDAGGASAEALVSNAAGAGMPIRDSNVVLNAVAVTATGTVGGAGFDTTGYASVHFVHQVSAFTGTILLQFSDDNTNWTQSYAYSATTSAPTGVSASISTNAPFIAPVRGRYVRFQCTAWTSQTASAFTAVLRSAPCPIEVVNIQGVSGTVGVIPATSSQISQVGTTAFVKSAATTNATSVKASAGNLFGICLTNNSAAVKYFKLYNKASSPTVGTDTPFAVLGIPANGVLTVDHAWSIPRFVTGIAYAITGAAADADTTAVAVNDVSGWLVYA